MFRSPRISTWLVAGLAVLPNVGSAQGRDVWARVGWQAVVTGIRVDPIPGGSAGDQFLVQEPLVMLHAEAWRSQLTFDGSLDLEGWTMPNGVLTLGTWGEGFDDRRHPHTYAHELVLSVRRRLREGTTPVAASASLGKGFVPFGTEDPMNRPALAYPVNHHWSQILERALIMAGVSIGPIRLETARFNGDEPEDPGQWPRIGGRFGDSWSHRATLELGSAVRVAASLANVKSPEHRPGAGPDQRKANLAARFERRTETGQWYALAEWARTSEADGFFVFHSVLGEAERRSGRHRVYYRFERTDRPEEERTSDPFRSLRPHLENSILGVTRWTVHTAGYGFRARPILRRLSLEPIVELARAGVEDRSGGFFHAADLYGRTRLWSATLAVRLSGGPSHPMGHYGVAADGSEHAGMIMR